MPLRPLHRSSNESFVSTHDRHLQNYTFGIVSLGTLFQAFCDKDTSFVPIYLVTSKKRKKEKPKITQIDPTTSWCQVCPLEI